MWLVCAATENELAAWDTNLFPDCERFMSGVGIPMTFARLLPKVMTGNYTLIVNIGIAGAYPGSGLNIGDVVIGSAETYADLGMELPDPPDFLPLQDTPFGGEYPPSYPLAPPAELVRGNARTGRGATVNTCTGTEASGRRREAGFAAAFETMEGAAVAHIGQIAGVAVCEIRAVSNIASRRDMRPANIGIALRNLREYLEACARNQ